MQFISASYNFSVKIELLSGVCLSESVLIQCISSKEKSLVRLKKTKHTHTHTSKQYIQVGLNFTRFRGPLKLVANQGMRRLSLLLIFGWGGVQCIVFQRSIVLH